jgi:hypothetical protein
MLRASAERRLEFPPEILTIRMTQQKFRKRPRVRRHIESLIRANARVRARRHVAHRISASLSRRDLRRCQTPHQARRIVNLHVVQLKILARGHMRDRVRIFLRQIRQRLKLFGVQAARRNLDPLHARRVPHRVRTFGQRAGRISDLLHGLPVVPLPVVVALSIRAAPQPRFREQTLIDLALLPQVDIDLERADFARQGLRDPPGQPLRPQCV